MNNKQRTSQNENENTNENFIFNQPCAIDLHLHLDGSISIKSARELAQIRRNPLCTASK